MSNELVAQLQDQATETLAEQMDRIRGRLLGMVEAAGMPPRQEAAIKQILKSLTYDAQRDLAETLQVNPFPYGLCQCGCGEPTNPYPSSRLAKGVVKGAPQQFVKGHRQPAQFAFDIDGQTGCWVWRGGRDGNGYGRIGHRHEQFLAHRFLYEAHIGPIPEGHDLHHKCHNRGCVNPAHLEPVTKPDHGEITRQRFADEVRAEVAHLARQSLEALRADDLSGVQAILTDLASLEK